jgi:hypothetical protein
MLPFLLAEFDGKNFSPLWKRIATAMIKAGVKFHKADLEPLFSTTGLRRNIDGSYWRPARIYQALAEIQKGVVPSRPGWKSSVPSRWIFN